MENAVAAKKHTFKNTLEGRGFGNLRLKLGVRAWSLNEL